jgi:hypothetical protein
MKNIALIIITVTCFYIAVIASISDNSQEICERKYSKETCIATLN